MSRVRHRDAQGVAPVKYALISDLHANLPAVEAVLADIRTRHLAAAYHLGDLVGYAPWPNETVSLIAASGIAGVAGNYDSTVATDYKHCGCRYEDPRQEALSHLSYDWDSAPCFCPDEDISRRAAIQASKRPSRTWPSLGGAPNEISRSTSKKSNPRRSGQRVPPILALTRSFEPIPIPT